MQCILTPDDIAHSKNDPAKEEFRARQNVILELGFFAGKLGRDHAIALVEKGMYSFGLPRRDLHTTNNRTGVYAS